MATIDSAKVLVDTSAWIACFRLQEPCAGLAMQLLEDDHYHGLCSRPHSMDKRFYEEKIMKCAICKHGTTATGFTTVVLEKDAATLVFKQVPAEICINCGEEYISSAINATLLSVAGEEVNKGVTLEVLRYAA